MKYVYYALALVISTLMVNMYAVEPVKKLEELHAIYLKPALFDDEDLS